MSFFFFFDRYARRGILLCHPTLDCGGCGASVMEPRLEIMKANKIIYLFMLNLSMSWKNWHWEHSSHGSQYLHLKVCFVLCTRMASLCLVCIFFSFTKENFYMRPKLCFKNTVIQFCQSINCFIDEDLL